MNTTRTLKFSLLIFPLTFSLQSNAAVDDGILEDQPPAKVAERYRERIKKEFEEPEEGTEVDVNPNIDPVVPKDLLDSALDFLKHHAKRFKNKNYLTIVDFKKSSDHARLYLIELKSGQVATYHTTQGQNSDPNDTGFATIFGNEPGSGKSSLGFYRTDKIYYGAIGRSLRIDGLSPTNSNVRARAVVFHGWDLVHERDEKQPRSYGCFALDLGIRDVILDKIKGGSLIYADVSTLP